MTPERIIIIQFQKIIKRQEERYIYDIHILLCEREILIQREKRNRNHNLFNL